MLSDKRLLRRKALARRAGLAPEQRKRAAEALPAYLPALLTFTAACGKCNKTAETHYEIFAVYYPHGTEIDSRPLIKALRAQGRKPALPAFTKDGNMIFRLFSGETALERGAFGLYEPAEIAPACVPHSILLPLVAFDMRGHRLGQGGGHYDKAIAALRLQGFDPPLIGLGFNVQKLHIWQAEPHDINLHAVLTEKGLTGF